MILTILAALSGFIPGKGTLIKYGVIAALVFGGWLFVRQHYINIGWNKAIAAVKKQDDRAKAAAEKVEAKTNECGASSFWDVVTSSCKEDQ